MLKKAFLPLTLLCGLALLAGCEEELGILNQGQPLSLAPDGAGSSPYYPFEQGKKWRYETIVTYNFDWPDDSPMNDTSWVDSSSNNVEVLRETELTGSNPLPVWEIMTNSVANDTVVSTDYYYMHVDTDSAYYYDEQDQSEPTYSMPSNPELWDEWDIVFQIDDSTYYTIHYRVVDDDVPANGFSNCLKVEVTPEDVSMYTEYEQLQYLADGEGSVMSTFYSLMVFVDGEDTTTFTTEAETKLKGNSGIAE